MAKQRYTTEEIIHKLWEADVLIGHEQTIAQVTVQHKVTREIVQTALNWSHLEIGLCGQHSVTTRGGSNYLR
jgi:hypothetical protein